MTAVIEETRETGFSTKENRYEGLLDLAWGLDTRDSPPCEIFTVRDDGSRCGKPSCKRVHCTCHDCGRSEFSFICLPCDEQIKSNGVHCYYCKSKRITIEAA